MKFEAGGFDERTPAQHLCISLCCNHIEKKVTPGSVIALQIKAFA